MKKLLQILGIVIILALIFMVANSNYKNAVEECVKNGNSRHYCEVELAK